MPRRRETQKQHADRRVRERGPEGAKLDEFDKACRTRPIWSVRLRPHRRGTYLVLVKVRGLMMFAIFAPEHKHRVKTVMPPSYIPKWAKKSLREEEPCAYRELYGETP